jgi:predicted nucleic acid-binding protein
MVPFLAGWHLHHERAVRAIADRVDQGEDMVVAAPALVEAYSVVTRLPPPHRVVPGAAWRAVRSTFVDPAARIVALDATEYVDLLARLASDEVGGGQAYDAVIAACAERAEVSTLLTFNVAHFRPLLGDGVEVVEPPDA